MKKKMRQIVACILMALTVVMTVLSQMPQVYAADTSTVGRISISDHDYASYEQVEGGVYAIYSDESCQNEVARVTTKKQGTADTEELVEGAYYVKQITPPRRYTQTYGVSVVVVEGGRYTIHMRVNEPITGYLGITNEGEKVSGWNGSQFEYELQDIGGVAVKVTAAEAVYRADGTLAYQQGEAVKERLEPKKNGSTYLDNLTIGTYEVQALEHITGYAKNDNSFRVEMEYPESWAFSSYENLTIEHTRQKAKITVATQDAETGTIIPGYEYTLYAGEDIRTPDGQVIVSKDVELETVVADENGEASFTVDIPQNHNYYIAETKAPNGYVRNAKNNYHFSFNCSKGNSDEIVAFHYMFQSTRASAKITLCVKDALTEEFKPQGDASFEGNVYGVYANEDIIHPDNKTGVIYQAGELVTKMTTDEKGEAEVSGLYLGKYEVRHYKESQGYNMYSSRYDVICNYEGQNILEVSRRVEASVGVICQPVFIRINVQKEGNAKTEALQGAGFSLYLKSELTQKEDGTYDFANATQVDLTLDGEKELFSNEYGTIFTDYLPYGTYIVVETTVPDKTTTAEPFEIELFVNSPKQALEEHTLIVKYVDEQPEPPKEEPVEPPKEEPVESPKEEPVEPPKEEPTELPKEEPVERPKEEPSPVPTAPKTGDTSGAGVWIAVLLVTIGAVVLLLLKKRREKK